MKLKTSARRHVEAEICEYSNTLRQMAELRRDIIESGKAPMVAPPTSQGPSIVERRATLLADSVMLKEMERITAAIRAAYHAAREECRRVVWIRYGLTLEGWYPPRNMDKALGKRDRFQLPIDEVSEILEIDDSTYHRCNNGFVYGVAERLGWY